MSRDRRVFAFMLRRRRAIVWLCVAAAVLLGARAQLHVLSHALQAVEASAHKESPANQAQACAQCLLLGGIDGAVPTYSANPGHFGGAAPAPGLLVAPLRVAVFAAYASRAPPRLG